MHGMVAVMTALVICMGIALDARLALGKCVCVVNVHEMLKWRCVRRKNGALVKQWWVILFMSYSSVLSLTLSLSLSLSLALSRPP